MPGNCLPDPNDMSASYDAVAEEYVRRVACELQHKPFDCSLLDRFARMTRPGGIVADVGCGPGHVGSYLHGRGVRVCGLDFSAQMIERARDLNPEIEFIVGDMRAIPVPDGEWAGILAFYSIIHIPPAQMVSVIEELRRVLEPGAPMLLAFHIGNEIVHLDEWWNQRVSVDFHFFQPRQVWDWLTSVGLSVEEMLEREPYSADIEHQSRRCYAIARRQGPGIRHCP